MTSGIRSVLVLGAGWTGRQIAAQIAAFGIPTSITDSLPSVITCIPDAVNAYAREQSDKGIWSSDQIEALNKNLKVCDSFDSFTGVPDLVIESVSEQSSTKRKALKEVSLSFPVTTIVASNSSYFLPSQLSRYVSLPHRFAHLHFHVPVAYATLVDIVPGPSCDQIVVDRLTSFAQEIGQTPLVQRVENPGYIFNWMLQSLLKSALELVDKKVATPEQIELAWKTVTKMPLGPIGIIDRIGVDVVLQVLQNARWSQDDGSLDQLIAILEPLVKEGKYGWKTGAGFFEYSDDNSTSN